jgi:hypothetical protein
MISPRFTIELTPEGEIVLLRNEARFDYCIENTFEDAYVEGEYKRGIGNPSFGPMQKC